MRHYRAVDLNVLWFLIALNVVIFIIELISPGAISFLGLTPALLIQQPWTIISSIFVHAGWGHIIVNMISLYFLGSFLLRAVEERSFLAVYFLGGLAGNILYFLLCLLGPPFGNPSIPVVGASGAIFALGGALVVMIPRAQVLIFPIPVPMPLWVAILIFFFISFLPGIAWQAHLGGLLLGVVAGFLFRRRRRIYYI